MSKLGVRSLDTALPASIDHIALNNQVVGMRKTVKRTKVQLINKMVKRVRVLKNFSKGSEQEIAKRRRKAERILQEIDVIKKLDPDQVSKFALSSTSTVKDMAEQPSGSVTKALAQFSCHKLMQELVGKFREKHPDWKALAAYLLAKNTGRRYKKKVTKEKVTAEVAATKREARDNLLNSFLQQKGADDKDISKPSNTLKLKNKEKKTSTDSIKELSVAELTKSLGTFDEGGASSDESNDETNDESDKEESHDETDSESHDNPKHDSNSESNNESQSESQSESNNESKSESSDESNYESEIINLKETKTVQKKKQNEKTKIKKKVLEKAKKTEIVLKKTKNKPVEIKRQSRHMVIQSFSLENSTADILHVETSTLTKDDDSVVPTFLTLNDSAPKVNRVKNDSFFMGGEDADDSGTESIGDKNDGNDSGSDLEETDQLQKGKLAMRSTFVGSLTDNRKDKMSTWATRNSTLRTQGGHGGFNNRKRPADDDFQQRKPWERNLRGSRGGFNNDRQSGRWRSQPQGERPWERSRETRGGYQDRRRGQGDRQSGRWESPAQGDNRQEQQPYQHRDNTKDNSAKSQQADTEEKLHPSWQASKLRKQQTGTIQSFTGKKTTFEDD